MIQRTLFSTLLFTVAISLAAPVTAQTTSSAPTTRPVEVTVQTDRPSGIYRAGEKITVQIAVHDDAPDPIKQVEYTAKEHGVKVVASGNLELKNHAAEFQTALAKPGALLFEITGQTASGKKVSTFGGAAVDYQGIRPSLPAPDDFNAFWDGKVAESAKLPLNPRIEKIDLADEPTLDYYKVTLDNINSTHIYGQLARPKASGKYPAVLVVQWAGVYPLQRAWVTDRAKDGWLALNILPHDVPFDLPESEFKKLAQTTLKDYVAIGQTDRETSNFLRMFLSCRRAAEYLTTRDDWNGQVLVVTGASQGGLQAIVTAALCPKVSAILISVPAGCDTTAQTAGRAFGWPYWQARAKGPDAEKIMNTSRYFDAVNFARRVKCPALVGLGLKETTCPASNVFAMTNTLAGPVEIVVLPNGGHQSRDKSGEVPYNDRAKEWLKALKTGQPAPVNPSRGTPTP